jgi:hypothetical protein
MIVDGFKFFNKKKNENISFMFIPPSFFRISGKNTSERKTSKSSDEYVKFIYIINNILIINTLLYRKCSKQFYISNEQVKKREQSFL